MKNKPKYSFWTLIFKGKDPVDRKYAPHIKEYFQLGFSNFVAIALISIFCVKVFSDSNYLQSFFDFSTTIWGRGIIALKIANYLAIIIFSCRLIHIRKKTEEFTNIAPFLIFFSLAIVFAPIAIFFALLGWKHNLIEYK